TKINNPREYIWYLSFNNANYNPILSATNPTYKVPFTQRSFSFKRGTYECGSAVLSSLRLSEPSSLNTPTPTNLNGRADLPFKNFCLSDSATITVSGAVAKAGSPIHTWQFSYDDITWFPLGGRQFNNASMRAFVGKDVVYYRRITIWCPSLVTDSTASIPLFLPDTLPWNENLNSHLTFGQNNFYNCFKMYSPDTNRYGTIQIPWFSNAGTGKNRTTGYTLQNPALPQPEDKIANNKLVVPSKYLYAGKTYRFSFFFKSSGAVDKCWDSLFVTVGKSRDTGSKMPDIRLPKPITNFEFDQWSRYWVDFSPIESDLYSFAVNVKEDEVSKGNFWLDDFSIKEVFSCQDRNPTRGTAEAPQKINDSIPENGKEQSRFQYAIGDTLMITYAENSYDDNFDYFGMTYSVEMARRDLEYHIWEDFAPIPNSGRNCFFQNFNNTHTINILATDTTTFYRIKAVCTLEDNPIPVYSDSVRINGTHYISYCENFESLAPNDGPLSHPNNNNLDITARGQNIPLGWSSYGWFNNPLNLNNDPFAAGLFPLPDPPAAPWFEPNSAFKNSEVGIRANSNSRKVLVMPGVRLHKGKGYRISFKYNDNRSLALPSNIYGGINNRIDSLYITVAKHYMADMNRGNFNVNTTPCRVSRVQVNSTNNIYESSNEFRFNEYTFDFIPDDTATYYFGINAHDPTMVNPYRFMIDYVCIDTLELSQKDPLSNTCYDKPKFNSQYMRIKINPDAKTFPYAQRGTLWCVGMSATICLEFTNGEFYQYWRAGWKYRFERTTDFGATWSPFGDSSNCIHYTMTSKPQDFRLILYNECNEGDTIGPFNVGAPNNTLPWIEEFEGQGLSIPSCWDIYTSGRVSVSNNIKPIGLGPKSKNNYMNINNSSPDAPANPKFSPYTVVPPTMFAEAGKTYRFSFWYRNNEKALPQDSIRLTYSYSRPQQTFDSVLPNRRLGNTPNDIVKNYNTDQYEYYTSEFKSLVDTNVIFKVQIHNATNKNRIYDLHLDDFEFKPKFDNDLVVIRVDSPRVRCESLLDSVTVRVMNIGNLPQSNFNVRVSADGGPIASAVFTGTLNSNEIGIVTIKNVVLNSAVAGNLLKVWSDIPGDQDKWDDTLLFPIVNYPVKSEPVYTLDSFCYNSEASVSFGAPNLNTVWYRNEFDLLSIQTNNTMTIPNLIRDTSFYVAYTSGFQRFTNPINTATSGVPGSSNLNLGLRFNNYHFKDLAITGFDVYVTQIGTFAYQLIDRTGTVIYNSPIINFTSTGLQEIRDLNIIVPPGFDYTLVKSSGTANLAIRNNYNFVNRGIPNLIDITASTAAGTNEFRQFFYFYNISFVDRGCETKRYRVDMRVRKLPEFTLKDTIRVCRLPQYQVCAPTAPPGFTYTYNWRHRPTDNSSCVIADSTRLYHLNITDQFGCKFIDSTRIIVDPSPVFDIKDTGICFGNQSIVVSSALSPNENFFVWSTGRTTPSLTISIPGIYTLTAVNLVNFCEATDTFKVVGYPLPEFSLGNDRVFCTNSNDIGVMLPPSLTYLWDNGSTNKFRPISASGRYSVIGTDLTTGCRNFDTIQATLVANPTLDLGPNDTVCGVNKVLNGPIGNFAYLWSTSNTSRSQLVSLPGRYYLTIIDKSFGCSAIDSIDITFRKPLELNMRKKIDTCISNFELRSPIVSSSYQWTGPVSSNASSINVDKSGVYKLTVNDGCYQVSDSTEVILNTSANLNIDLLPDSVRACRTASLMASSNPNGAQFNWNTGAKSNGINVNRTGSYSVSLFNSCGNITRSSYVIIDTLPVANFNMLSVIGGNKIPFSNRSLYAQSYLWDFGDGKTSREKNPIHTYLSSGVFQVTLTVTNSCGQSTITRKTVTVKSVGSGIKESEQALLFLYPNPTTAGQNTHLELTNIKDGMYSMKIFDLNGRLVHSQDKKALANKLEMNFVLEEISSAQYLIEITNEDNDKYSTRLQIK
ncbi:MAG: PKD domain-containing protein, partial [Chitinophagales bacterium]|nr:PKD domain-containing protein [Chitinophagales bacterium]